MGMASNELLINIAEINVALVTCLNNTRVLREESSSTGRYLVRDLKEGESRFDLTCKKWKIRIQNIASGSPGISRSTGDVHHLQHQKKSKTAALVHLSEANDSNTSKGAEDVVYSSHGMEEAEHLPYQQFIDKCCGVTLNA